MCSDTSNLFSIKQWAEDDRPREKLLQKGPKTLSDAELLAILIATGTKKETALDLARAVLNNCSNSLEKLGKLSVQELMHTKGIGPAKAITIAAALEISRRRATQVFDNTTKINNSQALFEYTKSVFMDLNHEEFWVVYLNKGNVPISRQCIGKGMIDSTLADIRIIFKHALTFSAPQIALSHNHPSGRLVPSEQDIKLTKQIIEAGKLLNISVVDHLIIAQNCYYSFADDGLL
ncbi:MAG: DNA repair protein RadC [Bacteroidia bacterium]|jgi:DNA repair protein RadC|nr:DNA repair protein RadC [Bacteroidia bacterium]